MALELGAGHGSTIEVIGDMTDPPWKVKVKMNYCKLREIFVKYLPKLENGTYNYSYIVDGVALIKQPLELKKTEIPYLSSNMESISKAVKRIVICKTAFQIKDFVESIEEYELLNKVLREGDNHKLGSNVAEGLHKIDSFNSISIEHNKINNETNKLECKSIIKKHENHRRHVSEIIISKNLSKANLSSISN